MEIKTVTAVGSGWKPVTCEKCGLVMEAISESMLKYLKSEADDVVEPGSHWHEHWNENKSVTIIRFIRNHPHTQYETEMVDMRIYLINNIHWLVTSEGREVQDG